MHFNVRNFFEIDTKIEKNCNSREINNYISYSFLNLIPFKTYAKLMVSYWTYIALDKNVLCTLTSSLCIHFYD